MSRGGAIRLRAPIDVPPRPSDTHPAALLGVPPPLRPDMKRIYLLIGFLFYGGCATTALRTVQRDPAFRSGAIRRVLAISLTLTLLVALKLFGVF